MADWEKAAEEDRVHGLRHEVCSALLALNHSELQAILRLAGRRPVFGGSASDFRAQILTMLEQSR